MGAQIVIRPADEDDAPTGIAATELGSVIDETEAHTAWSLDDGDEWDPPRRFSPSLITTLAVSASVLVAIGAGVLAVSQMSDQSSSDPPPPSVAAAPAPSTVTVIRPAPTVAAAPTSARTLEPPPVDDQPGAGENNPEDVRLLTTLRARGWMIDDPYEISDRARAACSLLRAGVPLAEAKARVAEQAAANGNRHDPAGEADELVDVAIASYRGCHA